MTLTPVGNRIVVALDVEKETTSAAGIILTAETGEKQQQIGTIIALGNGKNSNGQTPADLDLKVGQKVLFGKYGGEEYEDSSTSTKYKILKAEDVFAILA